MNDYTADYCFIHVVPPPKIKTQNKTTKSCKKVNKPTKKWPGLTNLNAQNYFLIITDSKNRFSHLTDSNWLGFEFTCFRSWITLWWVIQTFKLCKVNVVISSDLNVNY